MQSDQKTIDEALEKKLKRSGEGSRTRSESAQLQRHESLSSSPHKSMEGAMPAKEAEPGTLKTTLAETPHVLKMTEKTGSLQDKDDLNAPEKSLKIGS